MIRHFGLIAFRSFTRFKSTFAINLIGLSSGLACAVLIYLWVQDELGVDAFHEKRDRVFQVMTNHHNSDGIVTMDATPDPMAETLAAEVPEVELGAAATPSSWFGEFVLEQGEKKIKAQGEFVSNDYFRIFTFPLLRGDQSKLLTDKNSVIISRSLANRIFNSEDVVGKTITWRLVNLSHEVTVTGIFEDLPHASSERFDFALSFEYWKDLVQSRDNWGNFNASAYILVKEGVDPVQLSKKLEGFIQSKNRNANATLLLQPYSEKYLHGKYENGYPSGGRIEYVKMFSVIAAFILAIACVNFMNLSTARASRRMKEIGIKKAFGVSRGSLALQYLTESLLMALICMAIALLVVEVSLPMFSSLSGKTLHLTFTPATTFAIVAIGTVTGLLAGSYPAIFLSGFSPGDILKNKTVSGMGEAFARKGLVVFQFSLTIVLISSLLVVYKQIEYIHGKSVGFDKDHVIHFQKEGAVADKLDLFLDKLRELPEVAEASAISQNVIDVQAFTSDVSWPAKGENEEVKFAFLTAQPKLVETLAMELTEGRSFSQEFHDTPARIMFNETAIRTMGLSDPVGQHIDIWGEQREIIGVVKDFHFQSLHEPVRPVMIMLASQPLDLHHVMVRLQPGNMPEGIDKITALYKEFNPGYSFDYRFLDDDVQRQYNAETRVASLSRYFAGMAVAISCLGLFGLVTFTAERRRKEIGIRKALGSTTGNIVLLLTGDFTRIVLMAVVIGVPVSYVIAREWLKGFAFGIELEWWYFIAAGVSALLIAWVTIGTQALKAASVKPAEILRAE